MVYEGKISTCTSACSCPWNMAILYLTIYLDSSNTSRRHFKVIYSPYPKVNDTLFAEQYCSIEEQFIPSLNSVVLMVIASKAPFGR